MKSVLLKVWDHLEEIFLIPSLMFSVGLVFLQVIMRHVFQNSLTWSEELARYLYIWQTWIGISYAARNGSHLRITMVKERLPEKAQQVLEVFVTLVWIAFAIFIIMQGMAAVDTISRFGQRSSALQIPMQVFYYSIPVGMILMIIRLIERTIKRFLHKKSAQEGGLAS
jgi:TRAP-type C4-dicarboxylate transport system permease small subunit